MKRIRRPLCALLMVLVFLISPGVQAQAKTTAAVNTGPGIGYQKKTYKWLKKRGECYLKNSKERNVRGLFELNNRTYLFDRKSGRQRVGWQKYNGHYYYFYIRPGKKGYMARNRTINRIKLQKNGAARKTSKNQKKLKVLVQAQKIIQENTHTTDSKNKKLRKMWNIFRDLYQFKSGYEFNLKKDFPTEAAAVLYDDETGNCFCMASGFAFFGNACGYKNCKVRARKTHGWVIIDGYVYDPSWAASDRKNNYFHRDIALSGKHGSVNYNWGKIYTKKI